MSVGTRCRGLSLWLSLTLAILAGGLAVGFIPLGPGGGPGPAVPAQSTGLSGQLLVAAEELRDPRFVRTVVYVVYHGAGGAMGLIVNRPMAEAPVADLLKSFGLDGQGAKGKILVRFGGPVEPERGFVLHTTDFMLSDSRVVKDGIALTTEPEILRAIGRGNGPRQSLFALGYAGWAPGQLEREMKAGAWVTAPADEALIFGADDNTKWERAMARRVINL